jgi:single-stranded DNA-binding protein
MDDNSCGFVGRLVQDVFYEKSTQEGQSRATGRLIVNREGNRDEYDIIPFVAWDVRADNMYKYTSKGKTVLLRGPIRTNSVQDESGAWTNYFELLVLHVSFGADASTTEKKINKEARTPTAVYSKKAAEALLTRLRTKR